MSVLLLITGCQSYNNESNFPEDKTPITSTHNEMRNIHTISCFNKQEVVLEMFSNSLIINQTAYLILSIYLYRFLRDILYGLCKLKMAHAFLLYIVDLKIVYNEGIATKKKNVFRHITDSVSEKIFHFKRKQKINLALLLYNMVSPLQSPHTEVLDTTRIK